MTPDRITELAKQAGFYLGEHIVSSSPSGFQRFAELVRAEALDEAADALIRPHGLDMDVMIELRQQIRIMK